MIYNDNNSGLKPEGGWSEALARRPLEREGSSSGSQYHSTSQTAVRMLYGGRRVVQYPEGHGLCPTLERTRHPLLLQYFLLQSWKPVLDDDDTGLLLNFPSLMEFRVSQQVKYMIHDWRVENDELRVVRVKV